MSDHPIRQYVAKRQITVKVQYGKNLRKATCCAAMSTYVEVSLGKDTRRTETKKKAGRDPKWYAEYIFNYDNEPHIEIKCWCENGCCGEKLVGKGYLDLPPKNRINDYDVALSYKGKTGAKFGLVNCLVTFTDQGIEHLERDAAKEALTKAGVGTDPTGAPIAPAAAVPVVAPVAPVINVTVNQNNNNDASGQSPAVGGNARWEWDNNGSWKPMDASISSEIERGYQAYSSGGSSNVEVNMAGSRYSIHFGKMTQMNLTTKKIRAVRRG